MTHLLLKKNIIIILLLLSQLTFSQVKKKEKINIKGVVLSKDSIPIKGVYIYHESNNKKKVNEEVITGDDGKFEIPFNKAYETSTLSFSKLKYEDFKIKISRSIDSIFILTPVDSNTIIDVFYPSKQFGKIGYYGDLINAPVGLFLSLPIYNSNINFTYQTNQVNNNKYKLGFSYSFSKKLKSIYKNSFTPFQISYDYRNENIKDLYSQEHSLSLRKSILKLGLSYCSEDLNSIKDSYIKGIIGTNYRYKLFRILGDVEFNKNIFLYNFEIWREIHFKRNIGNFDLGLTYSRKTILNELNICLLYILTYN